MIHIMKNKKLIILSCLISFIYVVLGTISVLTSFPEYEIMGFSYKNPFWIIFVILTLPANILLFGLMMVEGNLLWVIVLQTIVFLIHWGILYIALKLYLKS